MEITVGARGSRLSRAQVEEIAQALQAVHKEIVLKPVWIETMGDRDQQTSLMAMDKSDFFTRDIDEKQLEGVVRLAVHSAKDLPDPLPKGLKLIALTQGVDNSDVLVLRKGDKIETLQAGAKIGLSSKRRLEAVKRLRPDLTCVDIRGSIDERLLQLMTHQVDGVVIANAALIRLKLTHLNCVPLIGEVAPLQGRLAILAREEDHEMASLFQCLDGKLR